jgi:hypothetical protein
MNVLFLILLAVGLFGLTAVAIGFVLLHLADWQDTAEDEVTN